jgi:hypothetical protein
MLDDVEQSQQSPGAVKQLREIRRAALRGADLGRDLLAIAQSQALQLAPTDLNLIAKSLVPALRRLLGSDTDVQTGFAANLAKTLGDPSVYGQIVMNLLLYARDASGPRGKVLIETANVELPVALPTRHGAIPPASYVTLRITYSAGLPPDDQLATMFEPFKHGYEDGLGLAAVYGTLKQLGGYITITPSTEAMTALTVYLPRLMTEPLSESPAQRSILLSHSERGFRQIIRLVLEQAGHRVLIVDDLETAGAGQPGDAVDLIVADPSFFGTLDEAATAEILARLGRPQIILIADTAAIPVPAVTSVVLQRPFDSTTFVATVNELLAARE